MTRAHLYALRCVRTLVLLLSFLATAATPALTQSQTPPASKPASSGKAKPAARGAPRAAVPADPLDQSQLAGLEWRSIGPYRGGRVTAVTGVIGQRDVYYFGGTGGGIWKTEDGGVSWKNMSDGELGTGSVDRKSTHLNSSHLGISYA